MPSCYYYDEQRNLCNCYVNENLNELLEENVNLRVQLANAMVTVRRVDERCAKLRELVRDMNKWLWNGADCTECPFTAKCDLNAAFESDLHAHICLGWSEIHDRMHELGIEVSE